MIKVFRYSLNNLYLVDEGNKKHGTQCLYRNFVLDIEKMKRVTKATVNKYLKDYDINSYNTYVITSPLLSTFATDDETRNKHEARCENSYIGSFENYDDIENYFKALYKLTKDVRRNYHFVNFESSLMEVIILINAGGNIDKLDDKEIEIFKTIEQYVKGAKAK